MLSDSSCSVIRFYLPYLPTYLPSGMVCIPLFCVQSKILLLLTHNYTFCLHMLQQQQQQQQQRQQQDGNFECLASDNSTNGSECEDDSSSSSSSHSDNWDGDEDVGEVACRFRGNIPKFVLHDGDHTNYR